MAYWEDLDENIADRERRLFKDKAGTVFVGYVCDGEILHDSGYCKFEDIKHVFDYKKLIDRQEEQKELL